MDEDVPSTVPPGSSQALFVDSWQVYRKMVDNDYLFHQGAYATLRRLLSQRFGRRPFTLLDIACGDASMTVEALRGLAVSHYYGIDLSGQALGIADGNVRTLGCAANLVCGDFASAIPAWEVPVDVAWIGLSLHHLQFDGKLQVMTHIRRIVGAHGALLIYEDTSRDGEDRDAWLRRWDAQQPDWTAYSGAEWDYVNAHVHGSDFPETDTAWRSLGGAAGFGRVEEHYRSPTDLFRLYGFEA
jgi:ubiquinone/menaquinone biosynthesis C-methylase UbiE